MDTTSIVSLLAAVLILVALTIVLVQYVNKRLSAVLAFVIVFVVGFGITAVQSLLLDPQASLGWLANRAGLALFRVLIVLGVVGIIRGLRTKAGLPVDESSSGISNPFSEDRFSFVRVFKAYVVILVVAVVGFAVWLWWLTRSM